MKTPFIGDERPDARDMERLRLLLSTYQDGSGMLEEGRAPGWRDFERVAASWIAGRAPESKHIYDVHLPVPGDAQGRLYGYSCKMKESLGETRSKGDFHIEVTNSSKKLWSALADKGITELNIRTADPLMVALRVFETIEGWHSAVSSTQGGRFITAESPLLHLAYRLPTERQARSGAVGQYQLSVLRKHSPSPEEVRAFHWTLLEKRLVGVRADGTRGAEWYFNSGGQVKWYPKVHEAFWASEPFELEPIMGEVNVDFIAAKAATLFPDLWADATGLPREAVEAVAETITGEEQE